MVGFLKKLFGGGGAVEDVANATPNEVHKGVEIRANPMKADGGQWRVAGTLSTQVGDEVITRQFVRADLLQGKDEAVTASVNKAKLIIDQNGDMIWKGEPDRPV